MARESPHPGDGWDETRETIDGFRTLEQSFYPGYVMPSQGHDSVLNRLNSRYPADYDYPVRYEGPSPESFQNMAESLSPPETVALFRNAVDSARQVMQQSFVGNENIEEAVQLKLTIDLNRQNIGSLPSEVIRIMNKDVER